jgi:hypothetical protein
MIFSDMLELKLQQFCKRYGLTVSTQYRDSEVISIQIVDDQAATYQLWPWKNLALNGRSKGGTTSPEKQSILSLSKELT